MLKIPFIFAHFHSRWDITIPFYLRQAATKAIRCMLLISAQLCLWLGVNNDTLVILYLSSNYLNDLYWVLSCAPLALCNVLRGISTIPTILWDTGRMGRLESLHMDSGESWNRGCTQGPIFFSPAHIFFSCPSCPSTPISVIQLGHQPLEVKGQWWRGYTFTFSIKPSSWHEVCLLQMTIALG